MTRPVVTACWHTDCSVRYPRAPDCGSARRVTTTAGSGRRTERRGQVRRRPGRGPCPRRSRVICCSSSAATPARVALRWPRLISVWCRTRICRSAPGGRSAWRILWPAAPGREAGAVRAAGRGRCNEGYIAALRRACNLDPDTRRAYDSRIRGYLTWLADAGLDGERPLADPHERDFAARDYRAYLKTVRKLRPRTVLAHLTALDHFYGHLGWGRCWCAAISRPAGPPRLGAREQKCYLRTAERRPLARDRAIARLLFYTGLRVGEPGRARHRGRGPIRAQGPDHRPVRQGQQDIGGPAGRPFRPCGTGGVAGRAPHLTRRLHARAIPQPPRRAPAHPVGQPAGRGARAGRRPRERLRKPAISARTIRHTFGTNLIPTSRLLSLGCQRTSNGLNRDPARLPKAPPHKSSHLG